MAPQKIDNDKLNRRRINYIILKRAWTINKKDSTPQNEFFDYIRLSPRRYYEILNKSSSPHLNEYSNKMANETGVNQNVYLGIEQLSLDNLGNPNDWNAILEDYYPKEHRNEAINRKAQEFFKRIDAEIKKITPTMKKQDVDKNLYNWIYYVRNRQSFTSTEELLYTINQVKGISLENIESLTDRQIADCIKILNNGIKKFNAVIIYKENKKA